jgi:hypothetical protein
MLMMPNEGTGIQAECSGRVNCRGGRSRMPQPDQALLSIFDKVAVFLKAPQVSLEQVKRPLGIPRIDARSSQTDYAASLLLYDAPPLGDELLGAEKIVFGIHLSK